MNLDLFLDNLRERLPEICTDKDLVAHVPNIFRSLPTIHRRRKKMLVPTFFFIDPFFYYLREDVISWIRSKYEGKEAFPSKKEEQDVEDAQDISKALRQ